MTELCDLGFKYKTDKSPLVAHSYTPTYYELFKDIRDKVKKVLEIGIGIPDNMIHSSGKDYIKGASLRMWRDFFPNAQIYGADIEKEAMFEDERIKTFLCDQTKEEDLKRLLEQTGTDIDIFIDDGAHYYYTQVFLARFMMQLLKQDVMYFIEDVRSSKMVMYGLRMFDCKVINNIIGGKYRDCLIQVKRK
jgi:hypothetical protein